MKKAFLTLCFLVSASFAMAGTIENKEEPTVQIIEEAKPNGSCTSVLANDRGRVTHSVTVNCGSCTDAEACAAANAAIDFIIATLD